MRKQTIQRKKIDNERKIKQKTEQVKRTRAKRLLRKGNSIRKIMDKMGVSNGTIMRIKEAEKKDKFVTENIFSSPSRWLPKKSDDQDERDICQFMIRMAERGFKVGPEELRHIAGKLLRKRDAHSRILCPKFNGFGPSEQGTEKSLSELHPRKKFLSYTLNIQIMLKH